MNHIEKRGASIDSGGEMKGRQPPADFEFIETGERDKDYSLVGTHPLDGCEKKGGGKRKEKKRLVLFNVTWGAVGFML
jgi:hypothetical protein